MLEFAFSTPDKSCLAAASWPLVFSAQLSAHVTFKENLVTSSINELFPCWKVRQFLLFAPFLGFHFTVGQEVLSSFWLADRLAKAS